jgi:hypothetical protein
MCQDIFMIWYKMLRWNSFCLGFLLCCQCKTKVDIRHALQMENLQIHFWRICFIILRPFNQTQDIKISPRGKKKVFGQWLFLCIESVLVPAPQTQGGAPWECLTALWLCVLCHSYVCLRKSSCAGASFLWHLSEQGMQSHCSWAKCGWREKRNGWCYLGPVDGTGWRKRAAKGRNVEGNAGSFGVEEGITSCS